ncbi:hypothetical protein Tco_0870049 [Tanacetum coccineum]
MKVVVNLQELPENFKNNLEMVPKRSAPHLPNCLPHLGYALETAARWIRITKKRTKNKATTNKTEHEMEKTKKRTKS